MKTVSRPVGGVVKAGAWPYNKGANVGPSFCRKCGLGFNFILIISIFKTLFKGKNFAVEWERDKFDFDPSCAKRSLMRVLSALSVVFQVSAQ